MSQDNEVCVKCGARCGYDDDAGYWEGHNMGICGQCLRNLVNRFSAFFGLKGSSWTRSGLEIEWDDVDKIMNSIKRDELRRVSYIVTDVDLYSKTRQIMTPVEQG